MRRAGHRRARAARRRDRARVRRGRLGGRPAAPRRSGRDRRPVPWRSRSPTRSRISSSIASPTTMSTARRRIPSRRCRSTRWPCAVSPRRRRRAGATFVHYGTDFVFDGESRSALRRGRSPEPAQRLRRLEAARRVVRAGSSTRLRASRREPVRRAGTGRQPSGQPEGHPGAASRRRAAAGVRGSHRVARIHDRHRRCDARAGRARRAAGRLSLREFRGDELGGHRIGSGQAARPADRHEADHARERGAAGEASEVQRAVHGQARRGGDSDAGVAGCVGELASSRRTGRSRVEWTGTAEFGLDDQGHHSGGRLGHPAASHHARRQQAADPDLQQAAALLPAVDADARRHPRHPDHHDAARAGRLQAPAARRVGDRARHSSMPCSPRRTGSHRRS